MGARISTGLLLLTWFFAAAQATADGELRVLHSEPSVLEVEWTASRLDLASVSGAEGVSRRPAAAGSFSFADVGEPDLPRVVKLLGIPWEGEAELRVVSVTAASERVPDMARVERDPFVTEEEPAPPEHAKRFGFSRDVLFPETWASLEGDFSMRGQRMTRLVFHPWRYDDSRGELHWAKSMLVRIEFRGALGRTTPERDVLVWESTLDSALLNAGVARSWRAPHELRSSRGSGVSFGSSPNWIRVPIDRGGLYKIDYFTFANLGIDPATIDPRSIRVFSGTNLQLEEEFLEPPPNFMTESALLDLGNQDGIFDSGDKLLFYALTPNGWANEYDPTRSRSEHVENQYTDLAAYWITWGGSFGSLPKRMATRSVAPLGASFATSAPHRAHFEENNRDDFRYRDEDGWFWESLVGRGENRGYHLELDRVASGDGSVTARLASWGQVNSETLREVELKVASVVVADTSWNHGIRTALIELTGGPFAGLLQNGTNTIQVNVKTSAFGSSDRLYTAWFEIEYDRELVASNDFLKFSADPAVSDYELGGFAADEVFLFDVSRQHDVVQLTDFKMTTPSQGRSIRFSDPDPAEGRWYVAASLAGVEVLPAPEIATIRGLHQPANGAEYVVIYHPSLRDGGERLAELRRAHTRRRGDPVLAVSLSDVYDEFSSGMVDPVAIRDFLAYARQNWITPPLFVALLGDAAYDTKGNVPVSQENLLSSYGNRYRTASFQQYDPDENLNFYPTDDFYGYLEQADYAEAAEPALDVAIGRFPSATPAQLDILLDKLESYLDRETPGAWQNRAVLVADDERVPHPQIREPIHTEQAETLATTWFPPALDKLKVYLTEYPFDAFGRKPEAQARFIEEFSRGALIVSYTGHGDQNTLAQEHVFVSSKIRELLNGPRAPIFTAFSCTVSKFDLLSGSSMTELLLHHAGGGPVATLASGGLVFSGPSFNLHKAWLTEVFGPRTGTLSRDLQPLGSSAMIAKAMTGSGRIPSNNEKYNLLGDPALVPRYAPLLAEFEGVTVDTDTIERSHRVIRAHVTDEMGRVLDGTDGTVAFHGTAFVRVTDNADTSGYTYEDPSGGISHIDYTLDGPILYEGEVPVTNGGLELKFLIPNTVVPGNSGRVSVFVVEDRSGRLAAGAYDRLRVAPTIISALAPKRE